MSGQALDRLIRDQSMALTSAGIRQHHRSTVDGNFHAMMIMWHKQALDSLMRLNKGFYLSTIGFCSATSQRHWISNQFAAPWKPQLHANTPYYTSMFEQTFGYVFVCIYTYKHMYICTHLIDVYKHTIFYLKSWVSKSWVCATPVQPLFNLIQPCSTPVQPPCSTPLLNVSTPTLEIKHSTCSNHYTWDWAIHIKPYISNPSMVIKM